MVGIQGADIVDGTRTLVLGLVWQMMRRNILSTMAALSKGGRDITDSDIVKWANDQVAKAGKKSSMRSFKDPSLKDAKFFLDLLDSLKPGYVDYSLVYDGRNDEECKANGECWGVGSRGLKTVSLTIVCYGTYSQTRHLYRSQARLAYLYRSRRYR